VECEGSGRDPIYPVVLKGVEGRVKLFQEFGIQNSPVGIDANRSVLPRQPHKCFYIGDGHIGMELTARTYQQYAQAGFDSDTLCMVLTSGQIRFDPETGERLPTYVIADSDGSGGSTALGSELPFYAPSCFSRGRTRVERQRLSATTHPLGCTVNFHPWSGRRLSPQEVAFFTRTAALQAGGDAGEIMEDSNNLARDASRILSPGRLQAIRARAPR
jgi:hypothetical protein